MAKIDWNEFEATYGWAKAVLTSNSELKRLAERAVKEGWTSARFIAGVRGTKWYRSRPESAREAIVLQKTDPGEYNRRLSSMKYHIQNLYKQMAGGAKMQSKWLQTAATQALMMGWTDEELRYTIGRATGYGRLLASDQLGGEAGQIEDFIRKSAADYGIKVSDSWIAGRLKAAMMDHTDQDGILENIKHMSKAQYRLFSDDIDRGVTIREIAEPYIDSMARILEVNPQQVDLFDPHIRNALTKWDTDKGKPVPKTIGDFENDLRQDPRWMKTRNAEEQIMGIGRNLLAKFGLVMD